MLFFVTLILLLILHLASSCNFVFQDKKRGKESLNVTLYHGEGYELSQANILNGHLPFSDLIVYFLTQAEYLTYFNMLRAFSNDDVKPSTYP